MKAIAVTKKTHELIIACILCNYYNFYIYIYVYNIEYIPSKALLFHYYYIVTLLLLVQVMLLF